MPQEYILMPRRSLYVPHNDISLMNLITSFGGARSTAPPMRMEIPFIPPLSVIDSIHEDGPKLVEADESAVRSIRAHGLRLEPVITYRATAASRFNPTAPQNAASAGPITVSVVCKSTGQPVSGAIVTAFTQFSAREGAEEVTNSVGQCDLFLGHTALTLDRLYIFPPLSGFWGRYQSSVLCNGTLQIQLEPVQTSSTDALAHFYKAANPSDGNGIKVGVVDTGIDNSHADLKHVTSGSNTAKAEPAALWQDNGTGHGTHVAGIIGARSAIRSGLAPGVELLSYRAFPANSLETTNYQILKAIIQAMDAGCHLINLSLSERRGRTQRYAVRWKTQRKGRPRGRLRRQ